MKHGQVHKRKHDKWNACTYICMKKKRRKDGKQENETMKRTKLRKWNAWMHVNETWHYENSKLIYGQVWNSENGMYESVQMKCEMDENMKLTYGKEWKYDKYTYEIRKSGKLKGGNVAKWYSDMWNVDKWHVGKWIMTRWEMRNEKLKMKNE